MTIASQTRTAGPFTGTGLLVTYPFAFKIFAGSDLLIQQTDAVGNVTNWTLGANFSVVLNSDQSVSPGGTVTPFVALPTGYTLNFTSAVALTQPASLTNSGGFFPKTIEDALDRLTILIQQALGFIGGALRVPEIGGVTTLPSAAARANTVLAFDSNGNPIASVPVSGTSAALAILLAGSALATQGAGASGFNPTLNYVAATIGQRLEEQISPSSFPWNAKFDNATDDTAAINACFAWALAKKLRVEMPSGIAITSGKIVHPAGVHCQGAGSGGYTPLTGLSNGGTIIQTTSTDQAWQAGQGAIVLDVQTRVANWAALPYQQGTYPQGTGNTPFGFVGAQSAMFIRCVAFGFASTSFAPQGATVHINHCFGIQSGTGLLIGAVSNGSSCTILNGVLTVGGNVTGLPFAVGQLLNFIPSANTATGCTIAGGVLTVPGAPTGDAYSIGQQLVGANIPANLSIASFGTGTGGAGTYNLAIPAGGTIPTIGTGQAIAAVGQSTNISIGSLGTGTGGAGTYNLLFNGAAATLTVSGARTLTGSVPATDGWCTDSVFMFNAGSAGIDGSAGNFWRYLGNRIEWNARYGIVTGPESNGVGNIGDRNGWGGIYMLDGDWGVAWSANYWSRNGCGGDPVQGFGRWGFSIPTDISWVPTPPAESCHVKLGFQRRVTFVGNTFRPGRSDGNDGALAPAFIYQFDGASGATPIGDLRIRNNSGDQFDTTPGFNAAAYGNIGAIATGTDTALVSYFINGFEVGPSVMQVNGLKSLSPPAGAAASFVFNVPKMSGGPTWIWVRPASGTVGQVIKTTHWGDGGGGSLNVNFVNEGGTVFTTAAAIAAGAAGQPYNQITLTFNAACFASTVFLAA